MRLKSTPGGLLILLVAAALVGSALGTAVLPRFFGGGPQLAETAPAAARFCVVAVVNAATADRLPAAGLGASGAVGVGRLGVACGRPFGLGPPVAVGVVSALNRSIQVPGLIIGTLIQTGAAINPGNS